MPEGPSIVILREQAAGFVGQTIVRASGNSKALDLDALAGQPVLAMRSWGKHFLIQLPALALRIHLMMFRIRVHPLSTLHALPAPKLREMV